MKYRTNTYLKSNDHELVNTLAKGVYSASGKQRSIILGFFYSIVLYSVGVIALIPRIIFRTKLGERTIGIFSILFIFLVIWFINVLYCSIPEFLYDLNAHFQEEDWLVEKLFAFFILVTSENSETTLGAIMWTYIKYNGSYILTSQLKWTWYIILILSGLHFAEVWNRNKEDEAVHSYYRGNSVLFGRLKGKSILSYKVTNLTIWMIFEPLFLFLISFIVTYVFLSPVLGFLFRLSAVALFIEEWIFYSENRNMLLDIADSNIDAKYINSVQEQTPESKMEEFVGRAKVS